MKKSLIKFAVFIATFIVALFVAGKIMNKGHDNLTVEMDAASLPLVTMEMDGLSYNQLHGFTSPMNVAFQKDTVTILGEDRNAGFAVNTYGQNVTGISFEVRSNDGSRLIENTDIGEFETKRNIIRSKVKIKDLIEADTEYSLTIVLELDGSRKVYYYTGIVWSDKLHVAEKLDFVLDFHERLYDREAARELTKYLETNSKLETNESFHKVNIHSSFRQITWGELNVRQMGETVVNIVDIASQTASFLLDYVVTTSEGKNVTYYLVEEYYRVRYSTERMYLLDYERTMTQLPKPDSMYANDKLLLGITAQDIPLHESDDGNVVAFVVAGRLFSYNVSNNSLISVFGFYNNENSDWRTIYNNHTIKILEVDEGGNIQFVVYGYMNRGRHEGEIGIQLYSYNSSTNTIEELVYISSDRSYSVLQAEMSELLFLNRENKLYLKLNACIYCIDLEENIYTLIKRISQDDGIMVSEGQRIVVSQAGDYYNSGEFQILNLSDDSSKVVKAAENEAVMLLGFMDEDIIYGVAKRQDIEMRISGKAFFPMYKLCICNTDGEILKTYMQEGIYVTDCAVEDNQIVINRLKRNEDGTYEETYQDHIMNNFEPESGKNKIVPAEIEVYERYIQIQVRKEIDGKSIKLLDPKEVVYEGRRILTVPDESEAPRYYVYGAYGIDGIYTQPARAVIHAYEVSGTVRDESGKTIWLKGNRSSKNQIMAIKEPEKTDVEASLAACLDTVFRYEGLVRNSEYLLSHGQHVTEIMEMNLENVQVLDMTGSSLDAMLYYVNQDIPVMALLESGGAVLITGFNDRQVVIMDPSEGKLYKKSTGEAKEWFAENGNCFITYIR